MARINRFLPAFARQPRVVLPQILSDSAIRRRVRLDPDMPTPLGTARSNANCAE
ncbi:hypothetical protein ABLO27_18075 [Roseibium sp. SCPC15]|uniref:hypothetical protein n=1 Tax=Roseibium sp. SCP15 TaxID=3141376 RepID=UPI00333584FB